jgi:aminocarboxymuconate-semialdehyde decarboxylase
MRKKIEVIDILAHHVSKSVAEMLETRRYYGEDATFDPSKKELAYPIKNADPEVRLRLMEKYGIDMQALSQTGTVLLGFNAEESAEICRRSNTDNYALCKSYPYKFVNVCFISLLDMKSAMKELSRAINELDCRGITVCTNQQGKGLDSPEYFPFYEKLVEHDLPLFLHPIHWESYPLVAMDKGWWMMQIFGWPFDTTQAIWRLIMGGVIDRFPSLKVVSHHLGAMFPYFIRRVEKNVNKFLKGKLPRPISEYWENIYGDTAMDGTEAAYPCGYAFFGSDRMIFGTDYPFGPEAGEDFIRTNLAGVKAMNIPVEDMAKILGGNAKRLLKIR